VRSHAIKAAVFRRLRLWFGCGDLNLVALTIALRLRFD
jgi:hypothetical protein